MGRAEKLEQAKSAIEESRTILAEKTKADQSQLKLSGFPGVIENIKTGTKFTLNITCETEDGTVLTATNGEEQVTGEVHDNQCVLEVYSAGNWNVEAKTGQCCIITIPEVYNEKAVIPTVYGVKIIEEESDPSKRVVYIDEATEMKPVTVDQNTGTATYNGWDETWIFDKIYPVMLKTDGTIDYKLNPNDYSQKLEGGESDVANIDYDGNAMVCIEKFYTKFSMDGDNEIIQISDVKKEGFEAIGFIREDGSEADRIFVPMFAGSLDSDNHLRSLSGQTIKLEASFNDFRTAAQKNGSGYDIEYWAENQIIQALFLILMKNCNSKSTIAEGREGENAKTGVANNKGAIGFDTSSVDEYKAVKFMHIEDFTTFIMYRWEAGLLTQNSKMFVKMKPPYSGTDTSDYTQVLGHKSTAGRNGHISKMKCSNEHGRYPIEYLATSQTYETCQWYTDTNKDVYISRRGNWEGVSGRSSSDYPTDPGYNNGAALTYMPPA